MFSLLAAKGKFSLLAAKGKSSAYIYMQRARGTNLYIGDAPSQETIEREMRRAQDIVAGNHGQAGSQTTYRQTIDHVFPTRYTWSPTRPDDDEDWRPSKKPRWQ